MGHRAMQPRRPDGEMRLADLTLAASNRDLPQPTIQPQFSSPLRRLGFVETSSSVIHLVRVRLRMMVRGFVVFVLALMVAMHSAIPSRACTVDETHAVLIDLPGTSSIEGFDLVEAGGDASNGIDPHHHTAPCQDHCNWFANISFQSFPPPEPGSEIELARQMLPALLAVAVPPPQ